MIVLDLDGTLLNSEKKVSERSKNYLRKLKDMGYIIVIATGRIYESIDYVMNGFEYVNYVITDNGASCYNTCDDHTIFNNPIELKTAKKFKKIYNNNCMFINVCDKHTIYKYSDIDEDDYFIDTTKDWDYIFNNCKEISHISVSMKTNEQVMELYNKLKEDIPELDINIMQDSFADRKWIETIKKGCTKYKAIAELANYLNINNDEIIAFGDGLNDIDMLKKCGIGVALSNALPVVKENANFITAYNHNHDGVIEFLKEYLNVE
ncbi:MAG: Cof-type HAD-IIB family hydrolase [bacterium]|nr:Cof-type HAD-IIB family hydrolase [bacterium]